MGGESSTPSSNARELESATVESVPVPISTSSAKQVERKVSDLQVIEADLTTTDEMDEEQETCTIEPPRRQTHRRNEQKLQMRSM